MTKRDCAPHRALPTPRTTPRVLAYPMCRPCFAVLCSHCHLLTRSLDRAYAQRELEIPAALDALALPPTASPLVTAARDRSVAALKK